MSRRWLALLMLAAIAMPAAARSEVQSYATLYGGYRFGGKLTDVATEESWDTTEGSSYAIAVDFGIDHQTQYQAFLAHRSSALEASGFFSSVSHIELGITYLHFGGIYFPGQAGRGAYASGTVGLTHFNPRQAGLSSETWFSLSLGFGYMLPLAERVALKLEGRGYATLVNSDSSLFCSGGCVVQIQGDTFTQGEVMVGIAVRF